MTVITRRLVILVLAVFTVAAALVFASLSSENGAETAAKAGGVVAVVADAKAKTAIAD